MQKQKKGAGATLLSLLLAVAGRPLPRILPRLGQGQPVAVFRVVRADLPEGVGAGVIRRPGLDWQ